MEKGKNGKTLPEKKFSTGAISAIIWKNNTLGKNGLPMEFKTIKLDRRYKDKDGNWQSTSSLRVNDLPKASLVLQKAYEYLVLTKGQDSVHLNAPSEEIEEINEDIVM